MEQSYKEKYEDILARLERAKNDDEVCDERFCCVIDDLIPELAESKNEKIRMEIINYFHCQSEEEPTRKEIHNKWIAWLENIPYTIDHEKREGFHLGYKACLERQGEQEKDILEDAILDGNEDGLIAETIRYKNEKQGEKKPASEEDEPQKELAKSYLTKFDEKFPILPTLKGKQLADYKNFLNKCQQIFGLRYWGFRPLQAKLFEKLSLLWAAWGAEHLQGLGQTDGDMDNEISMWSEEDKKIINGLIDSLTRISLNTRTDSTSPNYTFYKEIDWLKSLRPQNHWKPSSEQIGLLQAIINEPKNAASESCQIVLREVLEQLKKLKEE